jgi:alanine racemase
MTSATEAGVRLFVNQAAVQHNYQMLCQLHPQTDHGAVIKANGYGIGAAELAPILEGAGCKSFYVARPSEARDIAQKLSPTSKIYVFHGHNETGFDFYFNNGFIPILYSRPCIENALTYCKKNTLSLNAALLLNTGMNRLGLDSKDLEALDIDVLKETLNIDSIHSHLACGRTKDHPLNNKQMALFTQLCDQHFPEYPRGLSASCQLVLPDYFASHLTRQGLNIFGAFSPDDLGESHSFFPLQFALKVQAKILQVHTVQPGETIGYDASYTAPSPLRIATISMGYADGLPLSASNSTVYTPMLGDIKTPIVGKVSMDLTTLDVTQVPEEHLDQSSWVDVFYDNMSLYNLATAAKSSLHEIILRLGPRCERIFE